MLYSLVCFGPGRKPERWFSHDAAQMSCYVDGVFSDKIDQSISAKQSEPLVIICALCGSMYQKSKIKCDTCIKSICMHHKKETFQMYK